MDGARDERRATVLKDLSYSSQDCLIKQKSSSMKYTYLKMTPVCVLM